MKTSLGPTIKQQDQAINRLLKRKIKKEKIMNVKYFIMKEALEEIANPISFMRKRAESQGGELNGYWANQLVNDPHFLKSIAIEALNKIKEK